MIEVCLDEVEYPRAQHIGAEVGQGAIVSAGRCMVLRAVSHIDMPVLAKRNNNFVLFPTP